MYIAEHARAPLRGVKHLLHAALAVQTLAANDNLLSGAMPPFLNDGLQTYDLR